MRFRARHISGVVAVLVALTTLAVPASAQTLSTYVVTDDGTHLATDVYLPIPGLSWPVVLMRTPYGKSALMETCYALNALGFACVAQDTRGRFASDGNDTIFRDDGDDGRDTLQWLENQTWCNGRVGTFGASALGITQYMMAPGAPEVLRCQIPMVATSDLYHDAMFQGGALRESLIVNWLEGQGSAEFLDVLLEHRLWDAWWSPVDVPSSSPDVDVPALHIGGWYDIFLQGTLDAFHTWQHEGGSGARSLQHLVIGPWTHGTTGTRQAGELTYPENAIVDLTGMALDWLDRWLKDESTGVDDWPAAFVYLMGAVGEPDAPGNRWLSLSDWPPNMPATSYYLTAEGELQRRLPSEGAVELVADPADPVPTLGGANLFPDLPVAGRAMGAGPYDQRPIEARDDVLVFETGILHEPLTVLGPITARLWVVADTLDLDVAVRLTDVYPDGRSMLVTDGISRARMRADDSREQLLTPKVPTMIEIDLWSTALVFNAGHRIRISISGSNHPRFELNPNNGCDLNVPTRTIVAHTAIVTGPDHPSALVLPVDHSIRNSSGRAGR